MGSRRKLTRASPRVRLATAASTGESAWKKEVARPLPVVASPAAMLRARGMKYRTKRSAGGPSKGNAPGEDCAAAAPPGKQGRGGLARRNGGEEGGAAATAASLTRG